MRTIHVMAPKLDDKGVPANFEGDDEFTCSSDDPWSPGNPYETAYHPASRWLGDEDWECPHCETSTAKSNDGLFVVRIMN
jgi:hypothetical protein